ncbi:MAG: polysaccharide pyruvyl transferase family protein [Brevibacterium sp.]|uniref:polysaccharide pyruvyl transferase family protein n=1 Tax=Brevibacterium sp. TaxID=1701 RepID=UPI003F91DDBF
MEIGLIGINKYSKYLNFACDLHAYAFQEFLSQNGYSATLLDYKPVDHDNFDMRHPAKNAEKDYVEAIKKKASPATLDRLGSLAYGYRTAGPERERRLDKFEDFVQQRMRFTGEQYDSDLLEVEDPGFDCYICVTDVIWQSLPKHDFDRGFLLGSKAFEGKPKIAYAASRGAAKDFTPDHESLFFEYLDDIDTITVRERDFSEYIEARSNNHAPLVVDPVLLHDRSFWDEVAVEPSEERYLVLYYVMERATDTIDKAVEYAKQHDLTIIELSDRPFKFGKINDPDVKHVSRYDIGMDEWLGYIRNAEAVFTNSFHGCCFSMIFEKLFFAGRRNGQKVPNFLAQFGLDSQRFGPDTELDSLPAGIDYGVAAETLARMRQESSDLILQALRDAEQRLEADTAGNASKHDRRRRALTYPVIFNSGETGAVADRVLREDEDVKVTQLKSGRLEYSRRGRRFTNDGGALVERGHFSRPGHEVSGWTLRFRVDNRWFWYLKDGTVAPASTSGSEIESRKRVFKSGDRIPHLPVNKISVVVLIAQWCEATSLTSRFRRRLSVS